MDKTMLATSDKDDETKKGQRVEPIKSLGVCHKSVTHPFFCVFLYILVES